MPIYKTHNLKILKLIVVVKLVPKYYKKLSKKGQLLKKKCCQKIKN